MPQIREQADDDRDEAGPESCRAKIFSGEAKQALFLVHGRERAQIKNMRDGNDRDDRDKIAERDKPSGCLDDIRYREHALSYGTCGDNRRNG